MIAKHESGFGVRFVSQVGIFPCLGARDPELNHQLSGKSDRDWRSVRSLRRDRHEQAESCWLHTPQCCLSRISLDANGAV